MNTATAADAALSYSEARLFTEGASLVARPPGAACWRPFSQLSGGQQAAAALALGFALQGVAPLPFYFWDEVDACELVSWRRPLVFGGAFLACWRLGSAGVCV